MNSIFKNKLRSPLKRDILIINTPDGATRRFTLKGQTINVGRGDTNDLVIKHESVSRQHARLQWKDNQLFVEDLASMNKSWVADRTIPPYTPVPVPLGQSFWVGKVEVRYRRQDFTYPTLTVLCAFAVLGIFIFTRPRAVKKDPFECKSPSILVVQPDPNQVPDIPTPVIQPTATQAPEVPTVPVPAGTLTVTATLTPSLPVSTDPLIYPKLAFMDLPFPYSGDDQINCNYGTLAEFQQASQLAWMGGRFTSFFDHWTPNYPAKSGGREVADPPISTSLLLFTGELNFEVDYSGHPGYDFSTHGYTPVCAAANGIVAAVGGNAESGIYVRINHFVNFNGKNYRYQTFYLHMQEDQFWEEMKTQLNQPIYTHQRIGTMGNTGHSTGPHLHFEVLLDLNENGIFEQSEVVDPYGYIPSKEYPEDKWPLPSNYLWIYPMGVSQAIPASGNSKPDGSSGIGGMLAEGADRPAKLCAPANTLPAGGTLSFSVSLSPPPADKMISIGHAVVISVMDASRSFVERFNQHVRIMIPFSEAEKNYIADVKKLRIYRLEMSPQGTMEWRGLETVIDEKNEIAVAYTEYTGQFALFGESTEDKYPPRTKIDVSGPQSADGVYYDTVTVSLTAFDGQSEVEKIMWSLDGREWHTYTGPFEIKPNGIPAPRPKDMGDTFIGGPGWFQIRAYAIDKANNSGESQPAIEQIVIDPSKGP